MKMNQRGLLILMAGIAGFVGSLISNQFFGARVVSAQTNADRIVVAKRFQLVDENGRLRGFFSADPDGTSLLGLCDRSGKARIALAVKPDGSPSVNVYGVNAEEQVAIGVAGKTVGLTISTDNQERAFLGVSEDGKSGVGIFAKGGRRLWVRPDIELAHGSTQDNNCSVCVVGCCVGC